jgi:hypothetical protein
VHRRNIDLRAIHFGAALFGQSEDHLVQGRYGSVAEPVPAEGLRHAEADDDGFDFIGSEHKGGQFKRAVEAVADACLALNGNSRQGEIADIAIDGSLGDREKIGELGGGREPLRSQVLHDLKEPVGAAHAATLSGSGVKTHPVAFGVAKLGVDAHVSGQLCARQEDSAPGRHDAREHGVEGVAGVEVDDRAFEGWLEARDGHDTSAGGAVAIVGKDGERGGTHVAAVEGDCEHLLVERTCAIDVKRRDFKPTDCLVHGCMMQRGC